MLESLDTLLFTMKCSLTHVSAYVSIPLPKDLERIQLRREKGIVLTGLPATNAAARDQIQVISVKTTRIGT